MGFLNRKKKDPVADLHDHTKTRDADPYAFQVAHRRLAWMFRITVFIVVVFAISLGIMAQSISNLIDAFEPKVALLRVDSRDNKLYRVEPISENVKGFDMLLEQKAKRYVRLMLEVDSVTQGERFEEAFRMTDTAFYQKFRRERIESKAIRKMIDSGITRSITVESVNRVETNKKVHKFAVDFIQQDSRGNRKLKPKLARAYLTITTRPHEVGEIDKYENPLGITVLDMALKEKANS